MLEEPEAKYPEFESSLGDYGQQQLDIFVRDLLEEIQDIENELPQDAELGYHLLLKWVNDKIRNLNASYQEN